MEDWSKLHSQFGGNYVSITVIWMGRVGCDERLAVMWSLVHTNLIWLRSVQASWRFVQDSCIQSLILLLLGSNMRHQCGYTKPKSSDEVTSHHNNSATRTPPKVCKDSSTMSYRPEIYRKWNRTLNNHVWNQKYFFPTTMFSIHSLNFQGVTFPESYVD